MSDSNAALDEAVRVAVYEHFVTTGQPPAAPALAQSLGVGATALAASYRRLAEERALVLDARGAVWMAIPFSAVPTAVRVRSTRQAWWANCAFDGLGIPALVGGDAIVETTCPQSGAPLAVEIDAGGPRRGEWVLHLAVPLAEWWENIGHT